MIHRDPEFFCRDFHFHGEEFPRILNRITLEIIAEAEVAQHLEESVMARGVADVFQVVVLAAGSDATLRTGGAHIGPVVASEERILELHHAGIGKEERRIAARNQGTGRHNGMALGFEIAQKTFANFAAFHAGSLGGLTQLGP